MNWVIGGIWLVIWIGMGAALMVNLINRYEEDE